MNVLPSEDQTQHVVIHLLKVLPLQNTGANLHCFKNGLQHPPWFNSNNSTCLLELSSSHKKYPHPHFSGSCLLTRILSDNPITSLRLRPRNTIICNCTNTRILAKKSRHMVQMMKKQKRSRYTPTAQIGRMLPISRLRKPHVHCLKEKKHKVFSKDRIVSLTTCFPLPKGWLYLTSALISMSDNLSLSTSHLLETWKGHTCDFTHTHTHYLLSILLIMLTLGRAFHFYPDKIFSTLKMEDSTVLQNISVNLQTYMMSQPRWLSSNTPGTKAWEPILSDLLTIYSVVLKLSCKSQMDRMIKTGTLQRFKHKWEQCTSPGYRQKIKKFSSQK